MQLFSLRCLPHVGSPCSLEAEVSVCTASGVDVFTGCSAGYTQEHTASSVESRCVCVCVYVWVCVCVCMRACVCVSMCVGECVCVCEHAHVHVCTAVFAYFRRCKQSVLE